MGITVTKINSTIVESDEFEKQRRIYEAKEKEFDTAILGYYHNKEKIKKERMSRYMSNEEDYETIQNEMTKEIEELEKIFNEQELSSNMTEKVQKKKLLTRHKKNYESKIRSAREIIQKKKKQEDDKRLAEEKKRKALENKKRKESEKKKGKENISKPLDLQEEDKS
jgi:hypothetical protein